MIMQAVESYLAVRRAVGYQLAGVRLMLRSFARYATERGEPFVRSQTAIEWAAATKSVPRKKRRLQVVIHFARHMRAEDPRYEVPPESIFEGDYSRPVPFIYRPQDIVRLIGRALRLEPVDSLLPRTFSTLLALLASTGLRVCEALRLRLADVTADGLLIRETKFRKSRIVPLHETAEAGLERYLVHRRGFATADDHVFVSPWGQPLRYGYVRKKFREIVQASGLEQPVGQPRPQLHSFRHTFAVRALEACSGSRDRITRHMVALSTYLGHANFSTTYWYLQATPQLMTDIALASEDFVKGERS